MKKDKSASFKQSTVLPWIELRVANQSTACYDAHSHDEFSFGIINQGRADYRNQRKTHQIGQGDIVTINPADIHSCNPHQGTWSYSMLFVDALKMGEIQQEMRSSQYYNYLAFENDLERHSEFQQRYLALFSALQSEENVLLAQSCLYDFIELSSRQSIKSVAKMGLPNVAVVREKLMDELSHSHSLEELAEEVGMSRYQLLRAFKDHYGLPPYAYLMDEKIKRAKVMLKSGEDIVDVANNLGFSDQAHFQRHFKKKLAVTPKFYQSHFVE
ncbi:AraC family transcriptional regulator [Vibrio coralliilyticus]|uniref:AraC family transcriptional regulator n=1 Tax=Vibrio coralliilyticus TaxID=190893 RepID=UPI00148B8DAA|nr:AraC family transcriptional regulator [Vibrio coralliilyticus]NOI28536.1 AraC family transcriptional regulator [Vibrio coralliilyticus]NOI50720.1 AraC family transcriptional regulator [Vibrio coralliilyticus]